MKHLVEPVKTKSQISQIENYLGSHNNRDKIIWILGVNSGLRISDIISLNVSDVLNKTHIEICEKKTGKYKKILINNKLKQVLTQYTKERDPKEPLFLGKRGKRINRCQVYRFINNACKNIGINANVGTHTMRKSFGYHHYQQFKDAIILQKIFNHSSQKITLRYLGIEQEEIDISYKNFEL